ncbi:MAG TPA: type I methionyl aminopeptidase [Fimbriimonadaceae bacterium]|nr:type I methionyl aminopeptidase [Fimbriimonadaceae bacterium]HRJ32311.1 type I methionyl aminopeptidase [Fimbriimonadaceae bacterium]
MIILKKSSEIAQIKKSGRVVARVLRSMSEAIVPGKTTTRDLDALAFRLIEEAGGKPSFLNYRGSYPASICASVNDVVIHGIPNDIPLQEGDIVDLDVGVFLDGWHADSAWTYPVGSISENAQRLLNVTRESLYQGIAKAKVGSRVGDISSAVQKYCESHGYGVVRELVGHGIGRNLHEEPSVPNFGKPGKGPLLKAGTTMCIEPMVNEGTHRIHTLPDQWTMKTDDGKLSAHFEHTIAITSSGPEILTTEED